MLMKNAGFQEHVFDELSELNPGCSYQIAKKLCEEEILIKSKDIGFNYIILRLPPFLNKSKSSLFEASAISF